MRAMILLVVLASTAVALPAAGQDSTVKSVSVAPAESQAGTTVTATAGGSGLCGAVHIDWGDGAAITYATSTLPVTQTHVYKYGGAFTVRAQGMGNCTGQATTRVNVAGPPPPPPPATPPPPAPAPARLIAVELTPNPAAPRTPIGIGLRGEGTCRVNVDFGDGNNQELSGPMPLYVRHTYALEGKYVVVATPQPPCSGRQSSALTIGAVPAGPRINGVDISTPADASDGVRAIRVDGTGQCAYTLDFGDGNSEGRNAALPDVVRHNYPAPGRYTVVATPAPPCAGAGRSTIVIGDTGRGVLSRLQVSPETARIGTEVVVTIAGSGRCTVTVDFGDERQRSITATLPARVGHRYNAADDYEIVAWTEAPCSGGASANVRVRR